MIEIIGITGKAGAGKTTFANILRRILIEENLIYSRILPFAYRLKRIAREMGWNGEKDEKGRRLLQLLGTEVGRDCIGENVWVNLWQEEYRETRMINNYVSLFLIDDLRFQNEAAFVKSKNGIIVKIEGRKYDNINSAHKSESEMDGIEPDFIISNDGDVEELIHHVKTLITTLELK